MDLQFYPLVKFRRIPGVCVPFDPECDAVPVFDIRSAVNCFDSIRKGPGIGYLAFAFHDNYIGVCRICAHGKRHHEREGKHGE